jgi:hypothetical protein
MGRRLSHSGAQTSTQELTLGKALKPTKKFATKTFAAGSEAAGNKMFCTSKGGSGTTCAPKCVLNLFGSDSSTSNGETIPVERSRKHSKETSLALNILKSSLSKGMFE